MTYECCQISQKRIYVETVQWLRTSIVQDRVKCLWRWHMATFCRDAVAKRLRYSLAAARWSYSLAHVNMILHRDYTASIQPRFSIDTAFIHSSYTRCRSDAELKQRDCALFSRVANSTRGHRNVWRQKCCIKSPCPTSLRSECSSVCSNLYVVCVCALKILCGCVYFDYGTDWNLFL